MAYFCPFTEPAKIPLLSEYLALPRVVSNSSPFGYSGGQRLKSTGKFQHTNGPLLSHTGKNSLDEVLLKQEEDNEGHDKRYQ